MSLTVEVKVSVDVTARLHLRASRGRNSPAGSKAVCKGDSTFGGETVQRVGGLINRRADRGSIPGWISFLSIFLEDFMSFHVTYGFCIFNEKC